MKRGRVKEQRKVLGSYLVEDVLDRRVLQGVGEKRVEYYISWKGYGPEENSWEPEANLTQDLIDEYNKGRKREDKAGVSGAAEVGEEVEGGRRGALEEVERILGATKISGQLEFLVLWKGRSEAGLLPSSVCNAQCPQLVIKFYEERLEWDDN